MLRSLKDFDQYKIYATDGDIGSIADFLLDDQRWTLRYLVVETGSFFAGRRVLISPISFRQADWASQRFYLALTRDKIKHSPSIDTDRPVSRQQEWDYYRYYDYPSYWGYPGLWGGGGYPGFLSVGGWKEAPAEQGGATGDLHLRSVKEVRGYHVQGSDAAIGHVADFIIDDKTWEVIYLVIDTSNWWFGKMVLVATAWASHVSWEDKKIFVAMTREEIKKSPEWTETMTINRDYEERLYHHYGRSIYW